MKGSCRGAGAPLGPHCCQLLARLGRSPGSDLCICFLRNFFPWEFKGIQSLHWVSQCTGNVLRSPASALLQAGKSLSSSRARSAQSCLRWEWLLPSRSGSCPPSREAADFPLSRGEELPLVIWSPPQIGIGCNMQGCQTGQWGKALDGMTLGRQGKMRCS